MVKLLKRRHPRSSGQVADTPTATGTSAPAAGPRRSRLSTIPVFVRRLLSKLHRPRHPRSETASLNELESEGVLVSVEQDVAHDPLEEAVAARRPSEPAGEPSSPPQADVRGPLNSPAYSSDSSLEYVDVPDRPALPIPITDSEDSQSLNRNSESVVEIEVAPPSSVLPLPHTTQTPALDLEPVKDENVEHAPVRAFVTGSETSSVDVRSDFDPASGSDLHSSEPQSSEHFSMHLRGPAASSAFVETQSGPSSAVPAPALLPTTPYGAPIKRMRKRGLVLDPYTDPYYEDPRDESRLENFNGRHFTYVWRVGQDADVLVDNGILFEWKGMLSGGNNGKMVFGAHAWALGAETVEDWDGSLAWFPRQVAVKMVAKTDVFGDVHPGTLSYGSVVNEAKAMKALSSQPIPSAFVSGALAVFQDEDFFYIVSKWYSCTLLDYVGQTRSILLAGHTLDSPYVMDREVFRYYAAELLLGMEYLEQCGVVNCDIKPQNIFVTPSGHLALADFDLAVPDVRPAMRAQNRAYQDVHVFVGGGGTSVYKAPERFKESLRDVATPRADVWSLGIALLEFALQIKKSYFTERFPTLFPNVDDFEIAMQVIFDDFEWACLPSETRNSTRSAVLDPLVRTFIAELLALDPEARATVQVAKQHALFDGMDWDKMRSGAIEPPLLALGCRPEPSPIRAKRPTVMRTSTRLKHLQSRGMLPFADFGSDWIMPNVSGSQYPEHGILAI